MGYQCAKCSKQYTTPTADFFCEDCGYDGLLIEASAQAALSRDLGLCVLLMDASGSMKDPAYPNSPVSRLRLACNSAAAGVFDLRQMGKPEEAMICIMGFDHNTKSILFDSVQNLISKYNGNVTAFADYLYSELLNFGGRTDINSALKAAHSLTENFISLRLTEADNYRVLSHTLITHDGKALTAPNVRILIYTDGEQVPAAPLENPFRFFNPDILMGVYFGKLEDAGCEKLRAIISRCPVHDYEQFFLLDAPSKLQTLRKLFRMASGASGFCPLCVPGE